MSDMMDIRKYLKDEKVKPRRAIEVTMQPISNDQLYDEELWRGGIGIDASMKYLMDTELGKETTPLQQFHGTTTNGMQIL